MKNAVDPIASDNPYSTLGVGQISSIDAMNHRDGSYGLDSRPKVFDNATKTWTLLDSGSCVSCYPKGENDVKNPSMNLKSVNGGLIETYGTKTMTLRIGRKTYTVEGIIADVLVHAPRSTRYALNMYNSLGASLLLRHMFKLFKYHSVWAAQALLPKQPISVILGSS